MFQPSLEQSEGARGFIELNRDVVDDDVTRKMSYWEASRPYPPEEKKLEK